MREVPEGAGTRPERAAPTAHLRNNHLAREVVCVPSSAVHISFAGDREAADFARYSGREWLYTTLRNRHLSRLIGKLYPTDQPVESARRSGHRGGRDLVVPEPSRIDGEGRGRRHERAERAQTTGGAVAVQLRKSVGDCEPQLASGVSRSILELRWSR